MLLVDNLIDLKYRNFKSIIDYHRFRDCVTKKEIAQELDLSFATVSNMANLLVKNGLIINSKANMSKYVGRSPQGLELNPDRFYILSLDLHMDSVVSIYKIDLLRRVLIKRTYKSNESKVYDNIGQFMGRVQEVFEDFIKTYNIDLDNVIGAGVIMRGILDENRESILNSSDPIFYNQPVKKLFEEIIGKPVVVENDANLAAYYSAISQSINDLIYVYIDEGLGFGAIIGGKILRGENGYSSEIDHIPMGKLNIQCPYCNNYDCLCTDVSRNGFLIKYFKRSFEYKKTYKAEWEQFLELVKNGDPGAIAVAQENALLLGRALSTAICITWPLKIVIGGISWHLYEVMRPILEKTVNCPKPFEPYISVEYDEQCLETIAKGAAEIFYSYWMPDFI